MPAIKRILCPVDFSEASAHAIEQAVAVARWSGATLTVLHVDQPLFMPVTGLPASIDRVSAPRLGDLCDQTTAFVESANAVGARREVCVDIGPPVAAILKHAERLHADLIVMGTHGSSGFEHLMLGSVAEKVLRKAQCPVLTVPPRARVTSALPFRRILCAVDFSEWSIDALERAASLADQSDSTLDVLHVIEWPWKEPPAPDLRELPPAQAAALAEFRRYLTTSAQSRLEAETAAAVRGTRPVATQICHGKPYLVILQVAADRHADLIVLGVHSRGRADIAAFGSTANQVVRGATCPVLTVR